jgi:hypothetical protein
MPKRKLEEFPKTIFVTREPDGEDDSYLVATEDLDTIDSGNAVAIYERKEIGFANQAPTVFVSERSK